MPLLDILNNISVLVVGDLMLDRYLWGDVHRISPEAPVPIVQVENETSTAGGAANVALNLASLKVNSEVFGVIGSDSSGERLTAILNAANVLTEKIVKRDSIETITKSRVMAQGQQICRIDREGGSCKYGLSNHELDLLKERVLCHDAVIISDYAKGVVSQELLHELRTISKKKSIFIAVDPKPKRSLDLSGINLITPNKKEALEMAGACEHSRDVSLESICKSIRYKYNPEYLAITLSEDGILMCQRGGEMNRFPTNVQEVADVSGAGDTVVAVLTAALTVGIDANSATEMANLAAGIVVGKLGTATVSRKELESELTRVAIKNTGIAVQK